MGRHLVLVGCGHAHLVTLVNIPEFISRGHRVTVVSPGEFHYYSGMGPGLLAGLYQPEEIRFHIRKTAEDRGAEFKQGRVVRIDPESRRLELETGETVGYDVASFNTGSFVPMEDINGRSSDVFPVKPIEELERARERVVALSRENTVRVMVIGGGPAGIEMAGNVWRAVADVEGTAEIRIVSRGRLLASFPPRARRLVVRSLRRRGIRIEEGLNIERLTSEGAFAGNGESFAFDVAIVAGGIEPSPIFKRSGLPTDGSGALLVNAGLQSVAHPHIFGGGDCIGFQPQPLDKVGVYAVRQNPVLFSNLLAALEDRQAVPLRPQRHYMLLFNLGDGKAVFCRRRLVGAGRWAFRMKDRIDRAFMRRFQVSGETEGL
jgi:NADH dehydrogenase FAD-containing subunit